MLIKQTILIVIIKIDILEFCIRFHLIKEFHCFNFFWKIFILNNVVHLELFIRKHSL